MTGARSAPYIEPFNDDQKGLFMLQSNEYFDGKVKSIGFTSSSTGRASVGVMAEGEYTFGTAQPEEMTVVSGALNCFGCRVRLSGKLRRRRSLQCARQQVEFICRWLSQPLICAAICKPVRSPASAAGWFFLPRSAGRKAALSAVLRRRALPPGSESEQPARQSLR